MTALPQFLTSRQFADSLGVSESSVKRWVDDGTIAADRTAGGHRRIPLAAAIRYIRRKSAPLSKPHALPLEAAPQVGAVDGAAEEQLLGAMLQDRTAEARAIISGRYVGGAGIGEIADHLIRPVLHRLGELWHRDPEGILLEHRAVDTCVQALTEIGSWLPGVSSSAPAAVVGGGPGDPYLLPPMLASLVLRECGIRAYNLGPSTPLETIGLAMSRYGAHLCSISISATPAPRSEAKWTDLVRAIAKQNGRIVIGGRSSAALPETVRERARMCGSMSELAAYATGWLEGFERVTRKKEHGS